MLCPTAVEPALCSGCQLDEVTASQQCLANHVTARFGELAFDVGNKVQKNPDASGFCAQIGIYGHAVPQEIACGLGHGGSAHFDSIPSQHTA